jgi:hypothetical protein
VLPLCLGQLIALTQQGAIKEGGYPRSVSGKVALSGHTGAPFETISRLDYLSLEPYPHLPLVQKLVCWGIGFEVAIGITHRD